MFYSLLKIYARFAIKIYLRRIIINRPEVLKEKGPLLLAANHPNSFLDGIIITTLFDHPVHSLARGDVFKKNWVDKILRTLQLLPVYRTSEGTENLGHNYATFDACQETFKKNEIVLIFSEGRCVNEWHLRPLKKGTARLAITAWETGLPLKVIPTAFNYSSFKKFGKELHLYFGDPIDESLMEESTEGKRLIRFNELLNKQLSQMVYEINPNDKTTINKTFPIQKNWSFYFLLIPGIIGAILHAPLFYPIKFFSEWKFKTSGHYDSVVHALLIILYPFYLLIWFFILWQLHPLAAIGSVAFLPFTAWAAGRTM